MNNTFLLRGGNIGDRLSYLEKSSAAIGAEIGTITHSSSVYETEAWGNQDQQAFLNQVLQVATTLSAHQVLTTVLNIENQLGRQRFEKMGPRTIDIDILFFNTEIINSQDLTVPHPHIPLRRFVLTPMNEIAPGFQHPVVHKTISQLLKECPDKLKVIKYQ